MKPGNVEKMINLKIEAGNKHIKLFVINLTIIILLMLLCHVDFGENVFRGIVFGYYLVVFFVFFWKFVNDAVDVVDITVVFFMMYNVFATLIFSFESMIEKLQIFMSSAIPVDEVGIRIYLTVLLVSTMIYMHILTGGKISRESKKRKVKGIAINRIKSFFSLKITDKQFIVMPIILLLVLYLTYMNRLTGGVYIAYSGIANAGRVFNIFGWISIIGSGAIFAGLSMNKNNDNKIIYAALIIAAGLCWILKIRMYCAMFMIECIVCAYIRGFRFKKAHMIMLFGCGVLLLFGNVLRFSVYSFGNIYHDFFTVFGEFVASSVSGYYLVNNPLGFDGGVRMRDLIFQLLPSAFRPVSALDDFYVYYVEKGINPWPAGGNLFQGQLYFYFGIFSYFFLWIAALYLFYVKRKMNEGKISAGLAMFPVFCMSMPRLPVWVLRSMLVAGGAYFLVHLISSCKFISRTRWEWTDTMKSEIRDGDKRC